jgi:hypothetical protein
MKVAAVFGILTAVLWVTAAALYNGYIMSNLVLGLTPAELAFSGVLALIVAIGFASYETTSRGAF